MIRSTDSLRFYSSLSTGAVVGIVVPAVVAVLAGVAAFFYRLKFKSVEKAYSQPYNAHTTPPTNRCSGRGLFDVANRK